MLPNAGEITGTAAGLTAQEAEARLGQFGPNEPAATTHYNPVADLLHIFMNPLTLILLIAAGASAFLGDKVDAGIIGVIVLLSGAIDLSQTYRSQRAVEQLRDQVAPTATVLRGGEWKEIPRRDVVPGDIVVLDAGDIIPGDGLLIEANDLFVDESALTGETFPVEKEPGDVPEDAQIARRSNSVFLGTHVVSGTARVAVA